MSQFEVWLVTKLQKYWCQFDMASDKCDQFTETFKKSKSLSLWPMSQVFKEYAEYAGMWHENWSRFFQLQRDFASV